MSNMDLFWLTFKIFFFGTLALIAIGAYTGIIYE